MPTPETRLTGKLIRIREEGYGFIHSPGRGDFFVNIKSFRDRKDWRLGTEVTFDPGPEKAGKATPAYDVVAVSK